MFKRELTRISILSTAGLIIGIITVLSASASGQSAFGQNILQNKWILLLCSPFYLIGIVYGSKFIITTLVTGMKAWVIGLLHCRSWIALLIVLLLPLLLLPLMLLLIWIPGCIVAANALIQSYDGLPRAQRINSKRYEGHQVSAPTKLPPPDDDFYF